MYNFQVLQGVLCSGTGPSDQGADYKLLATTTNKNNHSHKHHQRVYYVLGTILTAVYLIFQQFQ